MLTRERLTEALSYDADTGEFRWRKFCRGVRHGAIAGCTRRTGYRYILLDGKQYTAHRLAWFYMRGEWPKFEIDHIDRVKTNNAIGNLRDVPRGVNLSNRARWTDCGGATFVKKRSKWRAQIVAAYEAAKADRA